MVGNLPKKSIVDLRGIVAILAAVAFVFGTLLNVPAADHARHDAAMESVQAHASALSDFLDGVAKSHCQENAGCHAAVLPTAYGVVSTAAGGAAFATWRGMAESVHLNDVFRPPLHA